MTKEDPERGDGMSDPWVLLKGTPAQQGEWASAGSGIQGRFPGVCTVLGAGF